MSPVYSAGAIISGSSTAFTTNVAPRGSEKLNTLKLYNIYLKVNLTTSLISQIRYLRTFPTSLNSVVVVALPVEGKLSDPASASKGVWVVLYVVPRACCFAASNSPAAGSSSWPRRTLFSIHHTAIHLRSEIYKDGIVCLCTGGWTNSGPTFRLSGRLSLYLLLTAFFSTGAGVGFE